MKKIITNSLLIVSLLFTSILQAQEKTVSGTVIDETGVPLAGVTILVKNATGKGTSTDFDGNYSLKVNENDVLVLSYIGFVTQEIAVTGKNVINVTMKEDLAQLDEVVVVGYGTQLRENVTGAVTSIKVEEVAQNRPNTNVLSSLQGVVPGLQITTNSGEPGNLGLITNIRGFTSINGGSPLILLDNVEVSPLQIDPNDIESVTVLKDLAASSIYGARAAFGVVLLTSKKGKRNAKPNFSYTLTNSISRPEDLPEKASVYDFVNALDAWEVDSYWTGQDIDTWVGFLEEYRNNPSTYPEGFAVDGTGLEYPLVDRDLWDELFSDNAFSSIHNFSVSGGAEKMSYRVGLTYSDENGTIITDNDRFKRYNLNSSLNFDVTNNLTSTTNIIYSRSNRTTSISSLSRTVSYPNYAPVRGNHVFDDGREIPYNTAVNLEELLPPNRRVKNDIRLFERLQYKPFEDLEITGEYSFTRETSDFYATNIALTTVHPMAFSVIGVDPTTSFYSRTNQYIKETTVNVYANYNKSMGNHNFKVLAGINRVESELESFNATKNNLINPDNPNLSLATGLSTTSDGFIEWGTYGLFGRLNYNFDQKYFVEANYRRDGSSRFPSSDKFSDFWSFSAGWVVSNEAFLKDSDIINHLKLRTSWGELGNQDIGAYAAFEQFNVAQTAWIEEGTGLRPFTVNIPNSLISPSFTWETVQTLNFGLDTRLFNNKLNLSIDVFNRKTLNMLTAGAELPAVLGANEPLANAADLETKGWELEMGWNQNIGDDFNFNLNVSLSDNQAEITKFENEGGLIGNFYNGRKIGEIWGYVTDGYYTVDDFVGGTLDATLRNGTLKDGVVAIEGRNVNPGDVKFKDLNGDGIINDGNNTLEDSGDRKIIGNSTRRYQYGVFGNVTYKNFDLSFVLNGVGKRDVWANSAFQFPYRGEFETVFNHQLDYWTPDNTNGFYPRNYERGTENYGSNIRTQTKYLLDGSYLRIRNLALGYSFSNNILDKLNIKKLRVFMSGENLANWDNLPKGINTELSNRGAGATYPFSTTYSLGLNLEF